MKLPANYNVIEENELCYLEGGSAASVADIVVTVVGAVFGLSRIPAALGILTGANYQPGDVVRASIDAAGNAGTAERITLGMGFGAAVWSSFRLGSLAINKVSAFIDSRKGE